MPESKELLIILEKTDRKLRRITQMLILFEKQVKGWTRVKKMALVNGDYDSIRLLAECRNHTNSKFHEN